MFGWFALAAIFIVLVWLLGHTYYLMTQRNKPPFDGHDGPEGKDEEGMDDEHR